MKYKAVVVAMFQSVDFELFSALNYVSVSHVSLTETL